MNLANVSTPPSLPAASDWLHTASGPWQAPTLLLAGALVLLALLALGLLHYLYGLRHTLRQTRHALAAERGVGEAAREVSITIFTLRRMPGLPQQLEFVTGDPAAMLGLASDTTSIAGDPLDDPVLREAIHPDDADAVGQLLTQNAQADADDKPQTLDFRVYSPTGLHWVRLLLASPHMLAGGGSRRVGCLYDISDANAHNLALRAARDSAEQAAKARAEFLATMSHEIRTPLNGVIGMLELLGRTPLVGEQRELLTSVDDSAQSLLLILNDVLDFSRLEAGGLRLDPAPFDPRTLLDNVVGAMAAPMLAKGLRVEVSADATLAGELLGDGARLHQILANLIGNATKFTERGCITVSWRVLGDDGDAQRLRIAVRDTGIGIANDKQAELFTPFRQAEASTARHYGGTGLGLAISRQLAQLMEGDLQLHSEPGIGTTIALELRLPIVRRATPPLPGPDPRHAIVRLRETDLAHAVASHLEALGFTVERLPPGHPLRPGMAAQLLVLDADDTDSSKIIAAPTLALDTHADAPPASVDDSARITLGANPLRWQALRRACELAWAPAQGQATTPAAPSPARSAARQTRCILVAEDHPVSRQLIRNQLDLLGWPCETVVDGAAALGMLRKGSYAALITDCNMPHMSGYDLARAWRQLERERGEPKRLVIIATTANVLAGERGKCLDAGMDDCLSKPLQLAPLQQMLDRWLKPEVAEAHVAELDVAAHRSSWLPALVATTRDDLDALDIALSQRNCATAGQRLHRMLGALPLLGPDPLLDEGRRLLERLHSSDTTALDALPAWAGAWREKLRQLENNCA